MAAAALPRSNGTDVSHQVTWVAPRLRRGTAYLRNERRALLGSRPNGTAVRWQRACSTDRVLRSERNTAQAEHAQARTRRPRRSTTLPNTYQALGCQEPTRPLFVRIGR